MDLREWRTDKDKRENGVWLELGGKAKVKVGYIKSERYRKIYGDLCREHRALLRTGDADAAENVLNMAIADGLILDWEGLTEDGKKLPYSQENARRIISDPEYKEFRDYIYDYAIQRGNFAEEEIKDGAKN